MPQQQQLPDTIRLPNYQQTPAKVPVGQWVPDLPAMGDSGMTLALNVVPLSTSSYGPLPSLSVQGYSALPSQCLGLFTFIDTSGNEHIFAGIASSLYHIVAGDTSFSNVTLDATTYNAFISNPWNFTSYGESIIAVDGVDEPQIYTVGSSSTFANLTNDGSAPISRYVATVRDFVMHGNCIEQDEVFPQRVHWSAIGNPSSYPALGTNAASEVLSDAQDLRSDLGQIRGLAAGLQNADVGVFMDGGVYAGSFIGTPAVFSFTLAQGASGCEYGSSIVVVHGMAFYLSPDGFYAWDGVNINTIGANKIDKWFFGDPVDGVDPAYISLTQGSADPSGRLIYWAYCGPQSLGVPNRLLIYNWQLGAWSFARISVEWLTKGVSLGYTLDQLDAFGTLETITTSFDSPVWQGGSPLLVAFNTDHELCHLTGPNMAATVELGEAQPTPGRRSRITSSRPLFDGVAAESPGTASGTPTVTIGYRTRPGDPVVYGPAVSLNTWGACPQRIDAQYVRAQVNMPAGMIWTHLYGAELDFAESTRR